MAGVAPTVMFNVVDSRGIAAAMRDLARRWNISMQSVFRYEMALWGEDLVKSTYPRGTSEKVHRLQLKRIAEDLKHIFWPMNGGEEVWWEKRVKGGEPTHEFVAIKDGKTVLGAEMIMYRPEAGMGEMKQHHMRYRNKTTGRVTMAGRLGSGWKNVGRWKFVDRMLVQQRTLAGYMQHVFEHAGRAKAGWMAMVRGFNGKVNAAWITRHESKHEGVAGYSAGNDRAMMTAENRVPYVSNLTRGIVAYTARIRLKHMDRLMRMTAEQITKLFNSRKVQTRITNG